MKKKQKILVLVDGSDRSWMTIDYIREVEAFRKGELVLYQVYSEIPECYWDLDTDPIRPTVLKGFEEWRKEKLESLEKFMAEAKRRLIAAGFEEKQVKIKIHQREKGIARDILDECKKGYDSVILRRRGMGTIKSITLGSVSTKLISKFPDVPMMLAGRRPHNKKLLLAVDGSPASTQAVDFIGRYFGPYDYSAELFHVIRGMGTLNPMTPEYLPPEIITLMQDEVIRKIDQFKKRLIKAGFDEKKVTGKVVSGAASRAEEIVREADAGNFGTIVIGRRGLSRVQDFFMGRVSYKVIHSGRDFTVWVV
ncbi:MAG: universal stress protein [Thermodesulfobacteriota bacterium]